MSNRHFISPRRLKRALDHEAPEAIVEAVEELLDEAWHKGYSAGQMRERMQATRKKGTW